jgi:hypothetical protein
MTNSSLLPALLLFLTAFFGVLWFVLVFLRWKGDLTKTRTVKQSDRGRLVEFLQDDLGQRLAAARVNLSALRVRMCSDGLPEPDELGTAIKLLDDSCRDIRTVSRFIEKGNDARK